MLRNRIRNIATMLVLAGLLQGSLIPLTTVYAGTVKKVAPVKTVTNKKDIIKIMELDKNWGEIGQYSEGLCPVLDKTTGMWGYVDKTGKYIIKPEYYSAMPFSEGLAAVKTSSGFYNFINKAAKVVISGKITDVKSRFHGEFAGFKEGLAVVSFLSEKSKVNYTLIDKNGKLVKELDQDTTYIIQMERFYNKGNIVTDADMGNSIYDNQYNKLVQFENSGSSRILFNYSTKYLILDKMTNNFEGCGLYIGMANGSKIFEQSKIPGMDNTNSYAMGVTDDYVIISKNINGIKTSAVFDFNGKIILDYKYKEVVPVSKSIFIVKNNADIFGIIDNKGKELVPFSLHITSLLRDSSLKPIYESAMKLGGVSFTIIDKQGKEKAKYFDFKSKQIKDSFKLNENGYIRHAFECSYNTEVGVIYVLEAIYVAVIYDSSGVKIGNFSHIFPSSDFKYIKNKELFISAGIIPILTKDKKGYTFAIIKK